MERLLEKLLRTLASLRITVVLLGLIVLLIFFGSLAQRFQGIWFVLEAYFKHPIVWVDFKVFAPAGKDIPGSFPFFGGVTLGSAMLVNLLAAFCLKFKPTTDLKKLLLGTAVAAGGATLVAAGHLVPELRLKLSANVVAMLVGGTLLYVPVTIGFLILYGKRGGMVMAHVAILLLIVGQGITTYRSVETRAVIKEGQTATYTEDGREYELAVIAPKNDGSGQDRVTMVAQWQLEESAKDNKELRLPDGTALSVARWFPNVGLDIGKEAQPDETSTLPPPAGAPMLVGKRLVLTEAAPVSGLGQAMENTPGALVTVKDKTYALYGGDTAPRKVVGTDLSLQLRPRRHFLPYGIRLEKFTHDLYPGTNTPKNYASRVTILENGKPDREITISMNQPLRQPGETLFQASFIGEDTTVLQVVQNPGWTIPYIACALGAIGLLVHFAISLGKFLKKSGASAHEPRAQAREQGGGLMPELALGAREGESTIAWFLPTLASGAGLLGVGALFAGAYFTRIEPLATRNPATTPFVEQIAKIPVVAGGRVQPFDSLARNSLLSLSGYSKVYLPKTDDKPASTLSADHWLLDVMSDPEKADKYPVFLIVHDEVKALIGQKDSPEKRFSMAQILPHFTEKELGAAFMEADKTPHESRDARQHALVELEGRIGLYAKLRGRAAMLPITPDFTADPRQPAGWLPLPDALATMQQQGWTTQAQLTDWAKTLQDWQATPEKAKELQQQVDGWSDLLTAWGKSDFAAFNAAARLLAQTHEAHAPAASQHAKVETWFNEADPFHVALWIYVCAALAVFASWAFWRKPLWRTALTLVALGVLVHALALVVRVWISGRPPVTNLYSSAVFVGLGMAVFSLVAEYVLARFLQLRLGFALLVGAIAGAGTLMIAKALAADGDTLAVLQAVLDTNFWLGTHVVVITLGYSATFLAGMLGITQLIIRSLPDLDDRKRSLWITGISALLAAVSAPFVPVVGVALVSPRSAKEASRALAKLTYGAICFALVFSFVGTILGGIWADQSWGRFWGWDPKENGAMMIVLWNALILHARIGGLVKDRGLAVLAVFGNIVTAWSWFGVNQLGAGLHSYGFTTGAFIGIVAFVAVNLGVMGLGLVKRK